MTGIIEVVAPNGEIVEFPAGTPDEAIDAVMRENYGDQEPSGFMPFLNRGIAATVGGTMDASNAIATAVGIGSERPFFGSSRIESGMRDVLGEGSAPRVDETADSYPARIAETLGMGVASILPLAAASRALQGGTSLASKVGGSLGAPFLKTPVKAVAFDALASAGAGAGGKYSEDVAGEGPLQRMAGEVLGSVATTVPTVAVARFPSLTKRAAKKFVEPFFKAGAKPRASNRVRSLAGDPDAARAALDPDAPNPGNLSPATRTGEPRLMALEKAALDKDAVLDAKFKADAEASNTALKAGVDDIAEGAVPDDFRTFVRDRREAALRSMDERIAQARQAADDRASRTSPERGGMENSAILRQELDDAYAAARMDERAAWAAVDRDAPAATSSLRETYDDLLGTLGEAKRHHMPEVADRLLGDGTPWSDIETVREVHGLYSELRRVAREAMAGDAPNRERARLAGELADAALRDLGAQADPGSDVGRAINAAREVSFAVNERFTRGDVGRLLGLRRTGAGAVPDDLTLPSSVGRGGARGAVSVDDIRNAVGDAGDDAIEDYLKRRFTEHASPRGEFNAGRAQDFMRNNAELLERFPALQTTFREGLDASTDAAAVASRTTRRAAALRDTKRSAGAAVDAARPGDEIKAIFRSKNPRETAASLVRQAAKDDTGQAAKGLKAAALDHLKAEARDGVSDAGETLLSGRRLLNRIADPKTRGVLTEILDPSELRRLQRLGQEIAKLETRRGGLADVKGVMHDVPNSVLTMLAKLKGAELGSSLSSGGAGPGLQAAQMGSGFAQRLLKRLTNDKAEKLVIEAVQNPALFRDLLMDPAALKAKAPKLKALNAWLAANVGPAVSGDDAGSEE